jgi:hypothetical protein
LGTTAQHDGGAHKSADSRTDLSPETIEDPAILPNSSRIEGILSAMSIPQVAKRPMRKMRGYGDTLLNPLTAISLQAEVVLADGRIIVADANDEEAY